MVGGKLRSRLQKRAKLRLQRCGDPPMQGLARAAQQRAVGGVLNQRVLEQIFRRRRHAALKDEAGRDEAPQCVLQFGFGKLGGGGHKIVRKVATDRGASLCDELCRRAEPIEAPEQGGMQRRRHGDRGRRRAGHGQSAAIGTGFDNGLGQLLDEQRHAIAALDDLGDEFGSDGGIAGKLLDQGRTVPLAEPVQRHCRDMRLVGPGGLEFRAKGNEQQYRQPADAIDGQIDQVARGRVDPVHVLEDHQHRMAAGERLQLVQQPGEQLFPFALRAQIELRPRRLAVTAARRSA